jgi:hypothetical protein
MKRIYWILLYWWSSEDDPYNEDHWYNLNAIEWDDQGIQGSRVARQHWSRWWWSCVTTIQPTAIGAHNLLEAQCAAVLMYCPACTTYNRGSLSATYKAWLIGGKPLLLYAYTLEYLYISGCAQTIYLKGMHTTYSNLCHTSTILVVCICVITWYSIVLTLPRMWCVSIAQHIFFMTQINLL